MQLQLETSGFDSSDALGNAHHIGYSITLLDTESDFTVMFVGVIIIVGHEPFIDAKDATRLEDTVDLAVHTFEGGSVHGGFNGIDAVEGVFWERHLLFSVSRFSFLGSEIPRLRGRIGIEHTMKSPFTKFN